MAELYDGYYYAVGLGEPYERNERWLGHFGRIADRIVSDISPRTVLDAGCALGMLVETLRERGVDAFGVDISDFAIANVHPSVRPFCWVGSLADPLPQRYDLIATIEVLEHISAAAAEQVIANLCAHTDDILFSSTPFDYKEATHCNVQPPECWAERFARHGFYRDVEFDASLITPWAARFRRSREPVSRVIASYERRWWQLQQENRAQRELGVEQRNALSVKEQELQTLRAQLAEQSRTVSELQDQTRHWADALSVKEQELQTLRAQLAEQGQRWTQLESSPGWSVLRTLQRGRAQLAPPGSARSQWLDRILRSRRQ